jgi:four helix bundle protein
MNADDLKNRTKLFAINLIYLSRDFPKNDEGFIVKKQIIRSATPVAANYRASCRARSTAEFISKLGIVEEESDESVFWLELLEDSGILRTPAVTKMKKEAKELTAIFTASRKTSKLNSGKY